MIAKAIQLIHTLFDYVDKRKQQFLTLSSDHQQDIDLIVDQIKNEFGNVNPKIIRNYSQKIIELQSISNAMQDLKIQLDIFFNIPSNLQKKQIPQICQESKHNIKRIELLIKQQLNDLSELKDIVDVENYQENEFDKICIFRLSEIYQNELDDLQYQFEQSQILNYEQFNLLNEKYKGIINDQNFIQISCQIQKYETLLNFIDDYRNKLFEIIKKKSASNENIIYYTKLKTKSLQYEPTSSLDLVEAHYSISSRQHPIFKTHKQEEIKSKRCESNPETCVKCQIF